MSRSDHTAPEDLASLVEKAKQAQDGIGWANYTDPEEFSAAVLTLAREVTSLARAVEWQQTVIDGQAAEITRLKAAQ